MRKVLYALTIVGLWAGGLLAQSAGGAFIPSFDYTISGAWTWTSSSPLVFEGSTDDANEFTIAVPNVTADVTGTIPTGGNSSFAFFVSSLTTNNLDVANSVWGASNALVFEGATANAFELTLSPADVGADRTVTIPDMGAASALLASTLTTNGADVVNSLWGASNALVFEGATADAFELTLSPADVGADRTVTIPDMGAASALLASTLTTNAADVANSIWGASNALVLEGATADAFEISVSPADAVADSTATVPNYSGNVVLQGLIAAGATETVAAVTHAGACIALDTGAGSVVTLPAATGTGNRYCFVVTATGAHQINVVGNDEFVGGIHQGNDSDNTTVFWPAADGSDNDRISLNGTSQGGLLGCRYEIVDISTDNWSVIGSCDASGTEATPFATGQVT